LGVQNSDSGSKAPWANGLNGYLDLPVSESIFSLRFVTDVSF